MTTVVVPELPKEFSGKEIAHLSSLRSAWRGAILAFDVMSETLEKETSAGYAATPLHEAIKWLIELSGDSNAGVRAAEAYRALLPYPMPDLNDKYAEDTMWDLFFLLVLAVQGDDNGRMYIHSQQLEVLVAGTKRHTDWWLRRARAYAPLGLTLATCV